MTKEKKKQMHDHGMIEPPKARHVVQDVVPGSPHAKVTGRNAIACACTGRNRNAVSLCKMQMPDEKV